MDLDWKDLTRKDELKFLMVSPTNLGDIYGELDGVDLSGSSLEGAYYSDTRTSGTISVRRWMGSWIIDTCDTHRSFVRMGTNIGDIYCY